jgi:predicted PurR-regulated permease PerM
VEQVRNIKYKLQFEGSIDKDEDCHYHGRDSESKSNAKARPLNIDRNSQKRLGALLFYAIVILLAYLVFRIVAPFLVSLAWAAVLVVVSYPIYEWLHRRSPATTAAVICTCGVTLVLIVPAVFAGIAFVKQGVDAVQSIQFKIEAGHFDWLSDSWTQLQDRFPSLQLEDLPTSLHQYTEHVAAFVGAGLATVAAHTAVFLFHLFVTILAMFYLYRDGDAMVARVKELLPFDGDHRDRMLDDAQNLIFASVTSSLAAALMHAILGGVAFALTGIKAPLFWGVMMGFFSFIPVVGSALIWVPASISLIIGGHLWHGILLACFCSVIVGLVDNFMRPWLISGRAELGGLVVFIAVLGGISAFGLLGVVLGPIIVATAASLLEVYVPPKHARNKPSRADAK